MSEALRAGYKLTEVGVIPEDWRVTQMSELGKFKNGINKSSDAFGHGYPFINLMDVFGVCSITSNEAFGLVDTNNSEHKTYDLKRGDVIFIRSSVKPSGVGLTAVIEENLEKTVYSGFLIRFRDNGILDIDFKRHCFYEKRFRSTVIAASSVSANTNINQDNLKKLLLALPPDKKEQRAIAAALSDIDTLLAKLDTLIAKKRNIKQATMQQLLTGQTRLPGFSGEWEVKRLGDVVEIRKGQLITEKDAIPGDIPVIAGGKKPAYFHNQPNRVGKTITVSASGASAGYVAFFDTSIFASDCSTISESKAYSIEFIYFQLLLKQGVIYKAQTGGAQPHIHAVDLIPLEIDICSLAEQTAIAAVLSDMDTELATLETRRDKTLALKQGMMQELLTGRIRLI
jgi:type I restriction enzyme S subunit